MNANPKRVDNLDITPAEDGFIIYRAELDRVHFLNPMAMLIIELCDGSHPDQEIIDLIRNAYSLGDNAAADVREALAKLRGEGLVV